MGMPPIAAGWEVLSNGVRLPSARCRLPAGRDTPVSPTWDSRNRRSGLQLVVASPIPVTGTTHEHAEHRRVYRRCRLRRKVGNGPNSSDGEPRRNNVHTQEHVPRRLHRRRNRRRAVIGAHRHFYAATLYNGIVGSSGQKANVSTANQLLTTEALPTSYRSYTEQYFPSTTGHVTCTPLTKVLPPGDAYNMQDLNLNVETTVSGASVQVFAAQANYCTTFGSLSLIQWITPAGVGISTSHSGPATSSRTDIRSMCSPVLLVDGLSSTVISSLPAVLPPFRVEKLTATASAMRE